MKGLNTYLMCLFGLILLFGGYHSIQQDSNLDVLYTKRQNIKLCMDDVEKQLNEIAQSISAFDSIYSASNIVESNTEITGYTIEEIVSVKNSTKKQLDNLLTFERELQVKKTVLESSLFVIDRNIANLHAFTYPNSRIASNSVGLVTIGTDGKVRYYGQYRNDLPQGFTDPQFAHTQQIVREIPLTNIIGNTTVVTEVHSVIDYGIPDLHNTGSFIIKTSSGKLYGWGSNYHFALGVGPVQKTTPREIDFSMISSSTPPIAKIVCQMAFCLFLSERGQVYVSGYMPNFVSMGVPVQNRPIQIPVAHRGSNLTVIDIATTSNLLWYMSPSTTGVYYCFASGMGHTYCTGTPQRALGICVLASNFKIYCLGGNMYGQLGDGTTTDRLPTSISDFANKWEPVASNMTFTKLYGGPYHFAAISTEGRLYTWGRQTLDTTIPIGSFVPGLGRVWNEERPKTRPGIIDVPSTFNIIDVCSLGDFEIVVVNQKREAHMLGNYNSFIYYTPFLMDPFRGKRVRFCKSWSLSTRVIVMEDGSIIARDTSPSTNFFTHPNAGQLWSQVFVPHPFY